MFTFFARSVIQTNKLIRQGRNVSSVACKYLCTNNVYDQTNVLNSKTKYIFSRVTNFHIYSSRHFSKKKRFSKQIEEIEEESDEEEEDGTEELEETGDGYKVKTISLPSMRTDSIIKAGLRISKKKVEKEFYANKVRLNGEKILKKATTVKIGDDIDVVIGPSPENYKLLVVDRIHIVGVAKITGTGNYPVSMKVYKELIIENYPDPWVKSVPNAED